MPDDVLWIYFWLLIYWFCGLAIVLITADWEEIKKNGKPHPLALVIASFFWFPVFLIILFVRCVKALRRE